jgi:hypothetical protein
VRTAKCKASSKVQVTDALQEIADIGLNHTHCRVGRLARLALLRNHGMVIVVGGPR